MGIKVFLSEFRPGTSYVASFPHEHMEAGPICGCTRIVVDRPPGPPEQFRYDVVEEGVSGEMLYKFHLPGPYMEIYRGGARAEQFFFGRNRLRVEIPRKGYGLTDCVLGNLFVGHDVKTSNLLNGHSPPRLVDPATFPCDLVWSYDSSWGNEAFRVMSEGDEAAGWRRALRCVDLIRRETEAHLRPDTYDTDLAGIHDRFVRDGVLGAAVDDVVRWLVGFVTDPDDTGAFGIIDGVYRELHDRMLREASRRCNPPT